MKKQIVGQIDLFDYLEHQDEVAALGSCSSCICHKCDHRRGGCPYGKCYDDKRKKEKPYMSLHDSPVTLMSNWENYLDEWCKGGIFYPSHLCEFYKRGTPCIVNGHEYW